MSIIKPKVSIIVPIYKSAPFVEDLMNSILNQSFKDFELICVNDGSPDNSLELLKKWSEKDKRIIIIDKPNGGVSSARNAGIEIARGGYIWFHDHDDYAFPDTMETMLREIEDRDILIAGWLKTDNRKNIKSIKRIDNVTERVAADNIEEMCRIQPFKGWIGCLWRCLFKRELLLKSSLRFKNLCYEDSLFIYEYLCLCESAVRINHEGYVHFTTIGSLGLSHNYCADEEWLTKAQKAAKDCLRHFNLDNNCSFSKGLHRLYTVHCVAFVTNGYHKDVNTKYTIQKRIKRWRFLRQNEWFREENQFGFITKFHKFVWYICHYRLYYLADLPLLLLTRIHDNKVYKK